MRGTRRKVFRVSRQFGVLDRQLANALAGYAEQRVTERRGDRRDSRLTHTGRQAVARHDVDMCLFGSVADPRHRVIVEVGLLDPALCRRDLAHQGKTHTKHRGAFELRLLAPSILAATLLVFLFDFTSFGVVLILGGSQFATVEVEIYRQTKTPDWTLENSGDFGNYEKEDATTLKYVLTLEPRSKKEFQYVLTHYQGTRRDDLERIRKTAKNE